MSKIRVLIADDETPARNKMLRLLQEMEFVEITAVAENGLEALDKIVNLKPDVAFLDIEMPGMTGLEVASNLPDDATTGIIFATAYNEHAIAAFELHAVDYLLKPFSKDRLEQALDRVNKITDATKYRNGVEKAVEQIDSPALNKIPIPTADRFKLIDYDEVVCIEVEDRNTHLYTLNKMYTVPHTLEHYERKLPTSQFFRISRACIINLNAIGEIVLWFGNRYKIILSNKKEVICSRERSRVLKHLLKL